MLKSVHTREQREKKRDPEGRMSLRDHLRELRNRLAVAVIAIVVFTGAALPFVGNIIEVIVEPLPRCLDDPGAEDEANCARLTYDGITSPFSTYVQVALLAGLMAASPVWLHQLWAFIAPGLHRNEKRYTRAVVAVGVPLFLTGVYFVYMLLPRAIPLLLDFTQAEAENLVSVPQIMDLTVKLSLAFGLAFELPLILALLNLGGVVTGRRMLGWWRGMVMGIALFSAVVTPTDPMSMIALAVPVIGLYFVAVGFSLLNDLRRNRRNPDSGLSDDQASDIDLTPSSIGGPEGIGRQRDRGDGDDPPRHNGYDDAT